MAASTAVSCLCLLLVAAVTFSVAAAAPAPAPPPPFRTVYAFGDSFTDTGNTHSTTGPYSYGYVSNPPYGATFFHRSTNRYSDGRLVVDFLATDALALPSFLPPYLSLAAPNASSKSSKYYGANFAVAGATAIEHDFFAKNNLSIDITPQSIMTELGWFDAHLKTRQAKKEEIGEALYWVGEIGANDYAYSFMAADSIPPERIRTMAVDRVTTFLERGARYVVVQGLPLTGCLPLAMTLARPEDRDNLSCVASVNKQSMDHNHHLQAGIHRLRQAHPGAVLAYADYYAAHLAVMRSPARYGFAEPFKTCCGSGGGAYNFEIFSTCGSPEVPAACAHPARYVNWDGVHMTEAMYKVVAGMFFRDASGTFIRPSFGSLLAAARKGHGN
ncbi:unnamed protein product [Triticum turgidum subsp. durum]|uniref:GDSL esterase/lipase n=1 Tax=Triticum turgidum subsp. durum TaxID=4567 RepID=A0A9R0W4Z5_TRITD|nr:unnamed protein product [Triticum turgidum subsp. durum]